MQDTSWDHVWDQGQAPPHPVGRVPWLTVIVVAGLGVWALAALGVGWLLGWW